MRRRLLEGLWVAVRALISSLNWGPEPSESNQSPTGTHAPPNTLLNLKPSMLSPVLFDPINPTKAKEPPLGRRCCTPAGADSANVQGAALPRSQNRGPLQNLKV